MCHQGKERNGISNQIGNRILDNLNFFINKNVSKLQIILMSLSFEVKKKRTKKREDDFQRDKKEHCDTRTHDVIKRNFKKISSHEINL